ncbi:hypothetical protein AVEN_158549-1 [Araneus ventricosus]|uniref:Uncharacterized protein n=1 Tax=Araneus ventricosus TaxID=182803 RepID=A0A4Y2RZI7_ARAVE|nr:hypothetical protein AVEN_158549-1 [Araneus ventricosus]
MFASSLRRQICHDKVISSQNQTCCKRTCYLGSILPLDPDRLSAILDADNSIPFTHSLNAGEIIEHQLGKQKDDEGEEYEDNTQTKKSYAGGSSKGL